MPTEIASRRTPYFRPVVAAALLIPLAALSLSAIHPQEKAEKKAPMAAGQYEIDTVHSAVIFKCKHMGASWSFGRFNDITGTFAVDPAKPEASKVDITIQTQSIDTANTKRDDHLRSPDFFDVKQFPTAAFKSQSVAKKGDNVYAVTGDLTFHGVTKSVTVDMEHVGSVDNPKGKLAGFFGKLMLKRSDYGMAYMPGALSDEIELTLSFEGKGK